MKSAVKHSCSECGSEGHYASTCRGMRGQRFGALVVLRMAVWPGPTKRRRMRHRRLGSCPPGRQMSRHA